MCNSLRRWAIVHITVSALGVSGCFPMTMSPPEVLPNGVIQGGEPRLRGLLEMMSSGRPRPVNGQKSKLLYAASVYPVKTLTLFKGTFPETNEHIAGGFSIAASTDSAETAQVALVVMFMIKGDALTVRQEMGVFRWERGKWTETTLLGLYEPEGEEEKK